jgi:hypothetical protein
MSQRITLHYGSRILPLRSGNIKRKDIDLLKDKIPEEQNGRGIKRGSGPNEGKSVKAFVPMNQGKKESATHEVGRAKGKIPKDRNKLVSSQGNQKLTGGGSIHIEGKAAEVVKSMQELNIATPPGNSL